MIRYNISRLRAKSTKEEIMSVETDHKNRVTMCHNGDVWGVYNHWVRSAHTWSVLWYTRNKESTERCIINQHNLMKIIRHVIAIKIILLTQINTMQNTWEVWYKGLELLSTSRGTSSHDEETDQNDKLAIFLGDTATLCLLRRLESD